MIAYLFIDSTLRCYGLCKDTTMFKDPWDQSRKSYYDMLNDQFGYQAISRRIKGTFTFPALQVWRL